MRRLAILLFSLVVVLLAVEGAFQRSLIYYPSGSPVPQTEEVIEEALDVTRETGDGLSLGAWLLPGRSSGNGITVLMANGNAGDRSLRAPLAQALAAEGSTTPQRRYVAAAGATPALPSRVGARASP